MLIPLLIALLCFISPLHHQFSMASANSAGGSSKPMTTSAISLKLSPDLMSVILKFNPIRDSGNPLTQEFVNACVREMLPTYVRLQCEDLVYPIVIKVLSLGKDRFAFVFNDEGSVLNDKIFKLSGADAVEQSQTLSSVLDAKLIAAWMNQTFKTKAYSAASLQQSAQSNFWIEVSKDNSMDLVVLSAEVENPQHSRKPVGKVRWTTSGYRKLSLHAK